MQSNNILKGSKEQTWFDLQLVPDDLDVGQLKFGPVSGHPSMKDSQPKGTSVPDDAFLSGPRVH